MTTPLAAPASIDSTAAPLAPLALLAHPVGSLGPDEILDRFLTHVLSTGIELYPAQEEALLELMAGKHVVLSTPTGSGKSLVATGLFFKALSEGKTAYSRFVICLVLIASASRPATPASTARRHWSVARPRFWRILRCEIDRRTRTTW